MMDGSLQVDRRHGAQSPERIYRRENTSNNDVLNRLDRYHGRTPGMRPLSLDAGSNMQGNANESSVDGREWQHESSAVPLKGYMSPQDESREAEPKEARGLDMSRRSDMEQPGASDHIMNPPDAQHMPRLEEIGRRRSQSTGFGPRGSKIAALSVQLRTRLSYAAARIEKKRQSHSQYQSPTGLLQKNSSTPVLSVETSSRTGQPLLGELGDQFETGSPEGTTVSAPDAPAASSRHPFNASIRQTLNITSDIFSQPQPDPQTHLERSSELRPPRLGPPADIDPVCVNGQRRRPNPNNPGNSSRYTPFPRHRRGRSQQGFVLDSEVTRVPETPPLRSSNHNGIPFSRLPDNSQSSSMEQDAIETLIFMSSPGTSGYHSNSQNSQRNQDLRSIEDSASQSMQWHDTIDDSQSNSRQPSASAIVEARAGDKIDLMLDQMNSDSDDDADYTFRHPAGVEAGSRANVAVEDNVQHRSLDARIILRKPNFFLIPRPDS